MEQEKNKRGGAREGAGRPLLDGKRTRSTIAFRITPENRALIDRMKAKGVHLGMAFDGMIPEMAARYGVFPEE